MWPVLLSLFAIHLNNLIDLKGYKRKRLNFREKKLNLTKTRLKTKLSKKFFLSEISFINLLFVAESIQNVSTAILLQDLVSVVTCRSARTTPRWRSRPKRGTWTPLWRVYCWLRIELSGGNWLVAAHRLRGWCPGKTPGILDKVVNK